MVEFNEKDAIAKATDFIFNYVRYTYNVKKGKRITIAKLMDYTSYDKTALYDFKSGARKAPVTFLSDLLSICGLSFNSDIAFLQSEKKDFDAFLAYFFNMQADKCSEILDDKLGRLDEISCSFAWEYALFYKFYYLITHRDLENVIEITHYILDKVEAPISLLVFAMYHDYRINKHKYNLEKMRLIDPVSFALSSKLDEAINNYYVAIDLFNRHQIEELSHTKPTEFFKQSGYMFFYIKLKTLDCSVMLFDLNVDKAKKELTSLYLLAHDNVPFSLKAHIAANLAYCYFLQGDYLKAKEVIDASLKYMSDLEQTVFISFKNLMQSNSLDTFINQLTELDKLLVTNTLLKKLIPAMRSNDYATIEQLVLTIYTKDIRKDLLLTNLIVLKRYFDLSKLNSNLVEIINNYIFLLK